MTEAKNPKPQQTMEETLNPKSCHVQSLHLLRSRLAGEVEGLAHLLQVASKSNRNEVVYLNRDDWVLIHYNICRDRGFMIKGWFKYQAPPHPPEDLLCSVC